MKNVKLLLGALLLVFAGAFIVYKVLDSNGFIENEDQQLQRMSIAELITLYESQDKDSKKGKAILKALVGKHEITKEQYILYTDFFWPGNGIKLDTLAKIDYDKSKLDSIASLYDPTQDIKWIEYKPTDSITVSDIKFETTSKFNKTTSCYHIPLFLGIKNLIKNNENLYVTKGKNYITTGTGASEITKLYTIILFRLERAGQPTLYYDISTDPGD